MRLKTLIVTTLLVAVLSTGLFAGETGENSSNGNNAYQHELTLEQEVHRELSRIKVKPTDKMEIILNINLFGNFYTDIYFKGFQMNFFKTEKKVFTLFKAAFGSSFTKNDYSNKIKIKKPSIHRKNVKNFVKKFNSLILESRKVRKRVEKAYRRFFYKKIKERVQKRREFRRYLNKNKTVTLPLIKINKNNRMILKEKKIERNENIQINGNVYHPNNVDTYVSNYIQFKKFKIEIEKLLDFNINNEKRYRFKNLLEAALNSEFDVNKFNKILNEYNYAKRIAEIDRYLKDLVIKFNSKIRTSKETRERVSLKYAEAVRERIINFVEYKKKGKKLISLYFCMGGGGTEAHNSHDALGAEIEGSLRLTFYFNNPVSTINYGLIIEAYGLFAINSFLGGSVLFTFRTPFEKYTPNYFHLAIGFSSIFLIKDHPKIAEIKADDEISSFTKIIPMVVFEIGYLYYKINSKITFFAVLAFKYGFKPLIKEYLPSSTYQQTKNHFSIMLKTGFGFNL